MVDKWESPYFTLEVEGWSPLIYVVGWFSSKNLKVDPMCLGPCIYLSSTIIELVDKILIGF